MQVHDILPAECWESITKTVYFTFWRHSLYDIHVPRERYEAEIKRMRRQIDEIDRFVPPIGGEADPKAGATKRKKDRERCVSNKEKLQAELSQQLAHSAAVLKRLEASKNTWFRETSAQQVNLANNQLLQSCIFPRCVFSPADAMYCAKFVQLIHMQDTPYFSTLHFADKLARDIGVLIFCCTERQASNFGRFLKEIMGMFNHWITDEAVFKVTAPPLLHKRLLPCERSNLCRPYPQLVSFTNRVVSPFRKRVDLDMDVLYLFSHTR